MAIDRSVYEFYRKKLLLQLANEHSGLLGVILSEVCDDDRCCVFFLIGES